MTQLSVVIPFYNEEENVRDAILSHEKMLRSHKIDYEIIAVNNGSSDNTGEILEDMQSKRLKIVTIRKNIGFGNGLIQGFKKAQGSVIGYTAGDNEIPPMVLLKVYRKLLQENLDICKVTRTFREYNIYRKMISAMYNRVICPLLFGNLTKDINGYPKLMKRQCYLKLNLKSPDSFIDTELLVKAKRRKFTIGEINSRYYKRKKGKSSVKFYIVFEFAKNLLYFKLKNLDGN